MLRPNATKFLVLASEQLWYKISDKSMCNTYRTFLIRIDPICKSMFLNSTISTHFCTRIHFTRNKIVPYLPLYTASSSPGACIPNKFSKLIFSKTKSHIEKILLYIFALFLCKESLFAWLFYPPCIICTRIYRVNNITT